MSTLKSLTWIYLRPRPHYGDMETNNVALVVGARGVIGGNLGRFKPPARKTAATPLPPEFTIAQQNSLEDRQKGETWTWSALRPSVVGGFGLGNPMNLTMAIAVSASMSKELGLPLRF